MATDMSGAKTISNAFEHQLIRDIKSVIVDAETLLKATANQGGDALATFRAKTEDSLAIAKEKMAKAEEKARNAASATNDYVRENPWKAVGAAAGLGVLIGLLIGRS